MMGKNRDDFPARVRHLIEKKSAFRCSNPNCRKVLIGPSEDFKEVVYMGVAAHIYGASPRGPRYDPSMTAEERASEENGLLLCKYCAALVDVEEKSYPPELLILWKKQAYQLARDLLMAPAEGVTDMRCWSAVQDLVRVCLCTYQTQGHVSKHANFRSCAGVLYRLLFEDLPQEADYDKQMKLWESAVQKIADSVLESVSCRVSRHDRSFPRRYRELMEELQTYDFQPQAHKAQLLNVMEAATKRLFDVEEAFGLKENNSREIF